MIKKEDRAFFDESLRGHITKQRARLSDAVEAVCLRGTAEDLEAFRIECDRYSLLLKAGNLLIDECCA